MNTKLSNKIFNLPETLYLKPKSFQGIRAFLENLGYRFEVVTRQTQNPKLKIFTPFNEMFLLQRVVDRDEPGKYIWFMSILHQKVRLRTTPLDSTVSRSAYESTVIWLSVELPKIRTKLNKKIVVIQP